MEPKCVYCLEHVRRVDARGLCKGCENCPESVRQRVLGQYTLQAERPA